MNKVIVIIIIMFQQASGGEQLEAMRTGGCYVLSQFNMPYALCFFENDFCLNLLGAQLKDYLTNYTWIYVASRRAPLHVYMISLFANCSTSNRRKEKKRKEKKKNEDRSMSRVREKAGLLRLLSCLAFLFFGILKQVNIAVERKTKGAIFTPFSVSMILFSGQPQTKIFIVALGE